MINKPEPFVRHGTVYRRIIISADEVLNAIAKGQDIDVERVYIEGNLDIRIIDEELDRDEDGRLIIRGSIRIANSRILETAYFNYAVFRKHVDFSRAVFTENTNFSYAIFSRHTDFSYATFSKYADFYMAIFSANVDYSHSAFSRYTGFSHVTFNMDAQFHDATFNENADFSHALFRRNLIHATYKGNADFYGATFNSDEAYREIADALYSYQEPHFVIKANPLPPLLDRLCITNKVTGRGEGNTTSKIIEEYDKVDCTVIAQPEVKKGEPVYIQVFAHIPKQAEIAEDTAKEFNGDAHHLNFNSLGTLIRRGSILGFELVVSHGISVDEHFHTLTWKGRLSSVQFTINIPKDFTYENMTGKVFISQDTIPIGQVSFELKLVQTEESEVKMSSECIPMGEAYRYQKAFISYSPGDQFEVERCMQMLDAVGIKYHQDIFKIKPGDAWLPIIFEWIDESDVFFLFWSSRAKESKWVEEEWKYALKHAEPYFILPIAIEDPSMPAPSEELEHIHFGPISYHLMRVKR